MGKTNLNFDGDTSSIGSQTAGSDREQMTGGFFWSSSKTGNISDKAQVAIDQKNFAAVRFMAEQGMISNYGVTDSNKSTVLHRLVKEAPNSIDAEQALTTVLSGGRCTNCINAQDKNGDTALHLAVKAGNHALADRIVAAGGSMHIKDNYGLMVDAETVDSEDIRLSETIKHGPTGSTVMGGGGSRGTIRIPPDLSPDRVRQNIINMFGIQLKQSRSSGIVGGGNSTGHTDLFTMLMGMSSQHGGGDNDSSIEGVTLGTESVGGARKKGRKTHKKGSRRGMLLAREVGNQQNVIHNNVRDRILQVLDLDKDKPDDIETVRNIKSVLWNSVVTDDKFKNSSPLEKAMEMDKRATEDRIKEIAEDSGLLEKGKKYREDSRKRREERQKQRKEEQGDKPATKKKAKKVGSKEEKKEKTEKGKKAKKVSRAKRDRW